MNNSAEDCPRRIWTRRSCVWTVLAAILFLYAFNVVNAKPVATFGVLTDDALYFSSAKALAAGNGYVLPGFPGHLSSMKYPELFPMLLAGVWKLDPRFPGNIAPAVGLTFVFGCLALLATFLMVRKWAEMGDWQALGVVLLVSLSARFIYYSTLVASDIPFMAVMLAAAWLTERSLASERGARFAFGAGALAGMSVGLRGLGIPVAAGIGLLLLFRRKFHRFFWFCLSGLPLTLVCSWPAVAKILGLLPAVAGDPARSGWTQTVCYYSSYACEWRMKLPNLAMAESVISRNLRLIAQEPGTALLSPLAAGGTVASLVLVMLLSAAAYLGIVRHCRRQGWHPLHAIFPLYVLTIVAFPYDPSRYLIPLAPVLFAGLWLEGQHGLNLVARRLRQGVARDERLAALGLGVCALTAAATVAANLGYAVPREMRHLGSQHEAILADEEGAYGWLRKDAAPNARIVAQDDGLAYLNTGRPSIIPIATLTGAFYLHRRSFVEHDAAHLSDVARHIDASYWLTTPYDYLEERGLGRRLLLSEELKLLARAPIVYHSPDGLVTLYDTRCIWRACAPGRAKSKAKLAVAPGR